MLTDYPFGISGNKLLYSTASVLFAGEIGGVDTVLLYGDVDQAHEFALVSGASRNGGSTKTITVTPQNFKGGFQVVDAPTSKAGGRLVLWADSVTAGTFSAPAVLSASRSSGNKLANFFQLGTNSSVLVSGPYLVRNATLSVDGVDSRVG